MMDMLLCFIKVCNVDTTVLCQLSGVMYTIALYLFCQFILTKNLWSNVDLVVIMICIVYSSKDVHHKSWFMTLLLNARAIHIRKNEGIETISLQKNFLTNNIKRIIERSIKVFKWLYFPPNLISCKTINTWIFKR